jgi:hypothetical protein
VRIQRTLSEYGGALLCDDVGLGKTYVALAVATAYDAITIVAPAALSGMWDRATSVTRIDADFISAESLGRRGAPDRKRSLIIVDEAHHFRNSCTRRYAELARMCMLAPVLLLTATPLHNSRDDVSAIAALFMGSRAYGMTDSELASIIVRRDTSAGLAAHGIPVVEHIPPRTLMVDNAVLDMILALPAPVPPSDGSVATRLVMHGLVRQWASSNAALAGALKRRIARSHGLLASLDAGRYPTVAELSAWVYTENAVQLAFAELLAPATTPLTALTVALRKHVSALTEILSVTRSHDDEPLATFVREIRASHPNQKIVAFSCYAETADALYRSLRRDGHVALLTARGAMIASGPITRAEILGQFTPDITTAPSVSGHESIDLLVATDLLSEGVNLQNASVVIHLDIPWTAARMEQRTGRLARMGSRHAIVTSYSITPSPRAEAFLRELEIVTHKSELAARIFGEPMNTGLATQVPVHAPVMSSERVRRILERWRYETPDIGVDAAPFIASVTATERSAIGAWMVDGTPTLLAWDGSLVSTDAERIGIAIELASAARHGLAHADSVVLSSILRAADDWYEQHSAWLAMGGCAGFHVASGLRDARRSLARVADTATVRTGFARRAESAAIAARLRNAAAAPLPLAVEWSLESLSECADEAAVNTILDLIDRARPDSDRVREKGFRCVAIILLLPTSISTA